MYKPTYKEIMKDWKLFLNNFEEKDEKDFLEAANFNWPPERIEIGISNLCNLDCPICTAHYEDFYGLHPKLIFSKEKIISFFKAKGKCKNITIASIGEPFLHPQIFEILDELSEYCDDFSFSTNLVLLTKEKIEKLKKYNIRSISVSTDAGDCKGFSEFRKGGDFNVFLENLYWLQKVMKDKITILSVAYNLNRESLLKLPKALFDKNISLAINISPVILHEKASKRGLRALDKDEAIEFSKMMDKESKKYSIPIFYQSRFFGKDKGGEEEKEQLCSLPFSLLSVGFNNKLVGCCCGGVESIYQEKFYDMSGDTIWNLPEFVRFRAMLAAGYNPTLCKVQCKKKDKSVSYNKEVIIDRLERIKRENVTIQSACNSEKYNSYFKELNKKIKNKNIAIYGLGNYALDFFSALKNNKAYSYILDFESALFFDDNQQKIKLNEKEYLVNNEHKISNHKEIDYFLVLSTNYEDKIVKKIQTYSRNVEIIKVHSDMKEY